MSEPEAFEVPFNNTIVAHSTAPLEQFREANLTSLGTAARAPQTW